MNAKWLNKNEVQKLKRYCKEHAERALARGRFYGVRDRLLIEFALGTGLRPSEIRDTQLQDLGLNYKNNSIPFVKVRTLKRRKKVVDVITITQDLAKLLVSYIEVLKLHKKGITGTSYLFPSPRLTKWSLPAIEKCAKRIFKGVDLPSYYSIHSLRHTHGYHIYQKEKNLKLVQHRLRHSGISTSAIYVGIDEEEELNTINGLYE